MIDPFVPARRALCGGRVMKVVGIRAAWPKIAYWIKRAQTEPVVITSARRPVVLLVALPGRRAHARPTVLLVDVKGLDLEQIHCGCDDKLWRTIARRRRGRLFSSQERRTQLGLPPR